MDCTSQWSRIAERPPTTDLSGGNASEDSFTRLMANLVVEYAVAFQSDLFLGAGLVSTVRAGDSGILFWSLLGRGKF